MFAARLTAERPGSERYASFQSLWTFDTDRKRLVVRSQFFHSYQNSSVPSLKQPGSNMIITVESDRNLMALRKVISAYLPEIFRRRY
jgi:hypothetical protein